MKKVLVISMAAMMAAGSLAGCSSKPAETTAAAAETAKAGEGQASEAATGITMS